MAHKVLLLAFAIPSLAFPVKSTSDLPVIDLGYSLHRANSLNPASNSYNFSNIRYGESTAGARRFLAPVPPQGRNLTIDDGLIGRICPQAEPAWFATAGIFVEDYFTNQTFAYPSASGGSAPQQDPRTTEDCLFLDVIVPKDILKSGRADAPVLVWIYGGGYVFGEKTGYDPSGLLANSPEPFIFVALNYRTGAFGFLGGPTVQASATAQPGLLDQRLALNWVQQHISLFGGSPSRVTVMGESAGAGSIMHQITAYGGRQQAPFSRAILQSPAFVTQPHQDLAENQTQTLFQLCNVSSITELQRLPLSTVIAANSYMVAGSNYGTFTFGPMVDGSFTPSLPAVLLAEGAFDQHVKILLGHNSDEGLLFTSPASNKSSGLEEVLELRFPEIKPSVIANVSTSIYPQAAYNGQNAYIDRAKQLISDTFVSCNTFYLRQAFKQKSAAYEFAIPPGLHGSDLTYTFATSNTSALSFPKTATALQKFLTTFATSADHNHSFRGHTTGNDTSSLIFGVNGTYVSADDTDNSRCRFWQYIQLENLL